MNPIPSARIRLAVFDLDGTLIDSQLDLANAVNAMLRHFGRRPEPVPVIANYIGDGALLLVRRALGDPDGSATDEAFVKEALDYFVHAYTLHMTENTLPYPGVLDSLARIRAARPDIQMAVLTNKPVRPSRALCDHFRISPYLFQNYGGNSFHTKKPDPEGLLPLMREAGVTPQQTVMIGDSAVDVLTARAAGAWSIGCTFGLSPHTLLPAGPDVTVDSPADWPAALGILEPRIL